MRTPDGRTLEVVEAGAPDGPVIVKHHGTPGSARFNRSEVESAEERGLRLVTYSRPGYGGSSPHTGRDIAAAVPDVVAILDELGAERFATYGWSGGGPHALACAALLGDRCAAAATLAGVGPADAPGFDFMAGMGEGNIAELGAAREGRDALVEFCRADAAGMTEATPEQLADALRPHLSDVDAAALTGELAEHLLESIVGGLAPGVDGWVDDDLAFLAPWGFDVGAIEVAVLVWQGEEDLMVPAPHAAWLREHVAGGAGGDPARRGPPHPLHEPRGRRPRVASRAAGLGRAREAVDHVVEPLLERLVQWVVGRQLVEDATEHLARRPLGTAAPDEEPQSRHHPLAGPPPQLRHRSGLGGEAARDQLVEARRLVHTPDGLERLDEAHALGRQIGHRAGRVALGDRRAAPQLGTRRGRALALAPVDDDLDAWLVREALAQACELSSPVGRQQIDEPRLLLCHY